MKRGWIVASIAYLALFAFMIWLSLALPQVDELGPGPGFFPFWLAAIGAVLSIVLIFETWRIPVLGTGESLMPDRPALLRILAVVLVLAAAAALLDVLGWRLTASLVAFILLPALGSRSLLLVVPFGLMAGFGVFHVFYYWLKVPLPIGVFGI